MRIAIVGGGYAGCAAALFLARLGHEIVLFEAVPAPGPVGAGILLQPTGQFVLEQLELAAPVREAAADVKALRARTTAGRELFYLPYSDVRPDLVGLGLHRGVLFEALFEAAQGELNVDVRLGVDVRSVRGGRVLDASGKDHGRFSLVVVANGSDSALRTGAALDQSYPWGALWFVAEGEGIVRPGQAVGTELYQVVEGAKEMLGFLPTGCAPGSSKRLTSMFWSIRVDRAEHWRRRARRVGLGPWKSRILEMEPRAEPVLRQVEHADQVLFAAYRDVRMRRWYRTENESHVVYIGDAAHAMSPQLGQGSNLALYDAMVLAATMEQCDSVGRALAEYQRRRSSHLKYYQRINRMLTPFFQSQSALLGLARDVAFPIATRIPFLQDAALQTLCGVRRGFLMGDPLSL